MPVDVAATPTTGLSPAPGPAREKVGGYSPDEPATPDDDPDHGENLDQGLCRRQRKYEPGPAIGTTVS
ncbi:hypothetical protein [Actinopolymorpha pittospori]|uniref:Uncharacterized protein n=1 Tax=Actinopolymorpha pittospori TaxID=648752 RepID=A0A927RAS1_9ACTN|nr:hypothetical protein [Actinopolymorpha pittospori]MBE1605340.1 hypothetical protein [Actinopolymorpha pittospori]